MNRIPAAVLLAATLLACPSLAQAQSNKHDDTARGGFLVQTDLEFGGDEIATVAFTNGDDQSIYAGQGISLGIGGWFRPVESSQFQIQGVLGYKYAMTAASNADINVSRVVMKLNGVYPFADGWFVGAGITHHSSPELNGDGFFEDIAFDDATGFSAELGWKWVALRYTKIEYSSEFYEDVDASSIGLSLTWRFGGRSGY